MRKKPSVLPASKIVNSRSASFLHRSRNGWQRRWIHPKQWGCLLAALFLLHAAFAQETILINGEACGMHGSSRPGTETYALNPYKNRYTAPRKSAFRQDITLAALARSGDPNQYSMDNAVVLRGYVYNVKVGGVETCNCKTKDQQYRDTHIELTPDESRTGPEDRVVVEVTPRMREKMAKKGVDWSTKGLRRDFKGRQVEIAGWLFYDSEHETGASANDPGNAIGERNWRATCWEVHPITYIKVLDGGQATPLDKIIVQQAGATENKKASVQDEDSGSSPDKKEGNSSVILLVGVLLFLVAAYFLLRKKLR